MTHLIYQENDFELNTEQTDIIQSGFYKCDKNEQIHIKDSFDINLVKLFLKVISSEKNMSKVQNISKHNIYMLFMLCKSWGIEEYQTKFGNFLFGPDYKANIQSNYNLLIRKDMEKLSPKEGLLSYKIHSLKYQADIEFSSLFNEKCLVDILDDENPWFYQSSPNDLNPYIIIYFEDTAHDISKYTIKMSRLPINLSNSKKWDVEGLVVGKKKNSPTVWKKMDSVFIVNTPKANDSITRKSLIQNNFKAIKITSKDKKLSLHSISFECEPSLALL